MYKITPRQKRNASALSVIIKPSTNIKKKIDVFNKEGKKIASIGAIGYKDFDMYIKEKGLIFANERRRLYQIRHAKDRMIKNTPGYYADKILW
jgi:hypothetical protein